MRISDWSSDVCSSDLRGDIDAAFVVGTAKPPVGTTWTQLYREPLRIITPLSVKENDPRAILTQYPFLRFDRTQHTGRQIDRVLQDLGIVPADFLELNAIEQLLSLVQQDVGVTLLPLFQRLAGKPTHTLPLFPHTQ